MLASVGVVGAFPMGVRRELMVELQPLVTTFEGHPWNWAAHEQGERTPRKNEYSRWNAGKDLSFVPLRPERVVEVRYDYMEGVRFRHTAQFVRWRPDREPESCTYAQLERPVEFRLADVLTGSLTARPRSHAGSAPGRAHRSRTRCTGPAPVCGRPRARVRVCERGDVPRPTRAELDAARALTVPDVLPGPGDPPLAVLFCGINPGLVTALTGHHFGRPGNRFWPALHRSGFTPRLLRPAEQGELRALGLGITNMVARATARADELTDDEVRAGGVRLRELALGVRPRWLAVVGITAYRVAFDAPRAAVGPQQATIGDARVWLLPNPSGLNAHWQLPELAAEFARLRAAAVA